MSRWREYFLQSADLPVIGASEEALGSIKVPACVVPGTRSDPFPGDGQNTSRLLPNSELHVLFPTQLDVDLAVEDWDEKEGELASIFVDFLNRVSAPARV